VRRKDKGLVTSIQGRKAVVMTKRGEFLKVSLPHGADIGSEIEFSRKPNFLPLVAGIILILFFSWTVMNNTNPAIAAYMTLDVNSGIELALDKNLNVVSVKATDEAGKEFVGSLKIKGVQVKEAVEIILDEAVNQRFLNKEQKGHTEVILATVTANNSKVSIDEEEVRKWVSEKLHKHELPSDVLVHAVSKEDRKMAQEQRISPAKYIIIKKIEAKGIVVAHTQKELSEINVRDLVMIMNDKKAPDKDEAPDKDNIKQEELVLEELEEKEEEALGEGLDDEKNKDKREIKEIKGNKGPEDKPNKSDNTEAMEGMPPNKPETPGHGNSRKPNAPGNSDNGQNFKFREKDNEDDVLNNNNMDFHDVGDIV